VVLQVQAVIRTFSINNFEIYVLQGSGHLACKSFTAGGRFFFI
jgi:hypothetical protein